MRDASRGWSSREGAQIPREGSEHTKRLQRVVLPSLCCQGAALPALLLMAVSLSSQGSPQGRGLWGLLRGWHCRQWVGTQTCFCVSFPKKLTTFKESQVKWNAPKGSSTWIHTPRTLPHLLLWAEAPRLDLTGLPAGPEERVLRVFRSKLGSWSILLGCTEPSDRAQAGGNPGKPDICFPPSFQCSDTYYSIRVLEVSMSSLRFLWVLPEGSKLLQERDYSQWETAGSPLGLVSFGSRLKICNF